MYKKISQSQKHPRMDYLIYYSELSLINNIPYKWTQIYDA